MSAALAAKNGLAWNWVRALILLAKAYQVQGREQEALEACAEALGPAQAWGVVRTFVDEGSAHTALLRECAYRGIARDYVAQLLAAFPQTMNVER